MSHQRKMEFDKLIAKGENPDGFTAQTVNGTAKATGTGHNRQPNWPLPTPQDPEGGAWQNPNSNRTGE